jgi:hypothetical protein
VNKRINPNHYSNDGLIDGYKNKTPRKARFCWIFGGEGGKLRHYLKYNI